MRWYRYRKHGDNKCRRFISAFLCTLCISCLLLAVFGCSNAKTTQKEDTPVQTSESSGPDDGSGSTSPDYDTDVTEKAPAAGKSADHQTGDMSRDDKAGGASKDNSAEDNSVDSISVDNAAEDTSKDNSAEDNSADSISADNAADGTSANDPAEDASDKKRQDTPRKLKYIDAWKEWHTMDVDPTVGECVYVPELFVEDDGEVTYLDEHYDVLQGVDVSEHQGYIDWDAAAASGIQFAFIRVGYRGYGEAGNLFADATAVDNLKRAKDAGILIGTYFFSQALNEEEAREEARLAVSVIEEAGVDTDLPLMYDPELIRDDWGRANEITREQVALNTTAFSEEVEKISSVGTDIYSNLPWEHNLFDADTLNRYQIWYADYEKLPQTPYHFVWWQYTNEGSVPGIEGRVDRSLWLVDSSSKDNGNP